MDIVVHQTNNAIYSEAEDETRWAVNSVLQKLITDVEDLLKRDNSDCVDNSSMFQDDLRAKTDQIYYDNLDILMKSSECKSGMNFEPPDQDVSARNTIYEDNQSDLLRSTELITNSSPEEVHPAVCNEQINQEGNQNIYSINVDLEESTNGLSSDGESRESTITECSFATGSDFPDGTTENNDEYSQMPLDSSDIDIEYPPDEIGDQEDVEDEDDELFLDRFERIIHHIRETNMFIMANRGAGDVTIGLDDDSEDESD